MPPARPTSTRVLIGICHYFNAATLVLIALFFLLIPGGLVIHDLADPNIRSAGVPRSAWKLHRNLSPRFEEWARKRLDSARAAELPTSNISGTEWPLFGSVFYLWATESLQDEWEKGRSPCAVAPKVYARGAVEAATRLVIDPKQANWVKIHWGRNYLKTENVFYRMLVISALTSHARLTGDKEYLPVLRDQVDGLSAELDASRYGWLDDYPGECYPGDVLTAVAMIHRADKVLGADHSSFVRRAMRGFQNQRLDSHGLVPYFASAPPGEPIGPSRGCGNSYVSLFSPEIWPEQARIWYDLYSQYFWQETWTCAGFREFPKDLPRNDWYWDVDAGPVLKGFGCAACAFGVGAARVNGHFEHAYPLTAEMLVTSWPLPNGTCLLPRLLSNAADAPYLGEAAILFNLTRLPANGVPTRTGGSIPGFVFILLVLQLGFGLVLLLTPVCSIRHWRKHRASAILQHPGTQFGIWVGLLVACTFCVFFGKTLVAMLLLFCAQLFPRYKRKRARSPEQPAIEPDGAHQ
ncbi:MAG: hypothetical protein ABSA45_08200 [Verrucomicrobiota bacterium]|jgi:hypothetical protein